MRGVSGSKSLDVTDHLRTEQQIADYFEAIVREGDPALMVAAIADVARARNRGIKLADLKVFDPANYLDCEEAIVAFLAHMAGLNDPIMRESGQAAAERARQRLRQDAGYLDNSL